jgi:hypothetical protein
MAIDGRLSSFQVSKNLFDGFISDLVGRLAPLALSEEQDGDGFCFENKAQPGAGTTGPGFDGHFRAEAFGLETLGRPARHTVGNIFGQTGHGTESANGNFVTITDVQSR